MDSIAVLLDALFPVLHEVTQCEQGVIAHRDLVFRRPRFHGYQNDACVQLLLVDLLKWSRRRNKLGINQSALLKVTRRIICHPQRRPCSPPIWQNSSSVLWNDAAAQTIQTTEETVNCDCPPNFLLSDASVPAHGRSPP